MRVQIIQPLVPHYRIPLFEALSQRPELSVSVHASRESPGDRSLQSVRGLPYAELDHPCLSLLSRRFFWQRCLRLRSDLQSGDVLVVNGNFRVLSNWPLLVRARRRRIGIVWWGHGSSRHPKPLIEKGRWRAMQWVDSVLLYTDKEVDAYVARGFPPEKLFATNNTLDLEPIDSAMRMWTPDRLREFRAEQRIQGGLLLFCGRLKPCCGVDLAIEALRRLRQQGRACQLAVVGEGSEQVALHAYAREAGLGEQIRWLGAVYDQAQLAPWFLSANAFVYPGPVGLSLIHAMAYGLPVVTHNNSQNHHPEIAALDDGINGLLFSEGDVDDLSAKLATLLDRPQYRQDLGQRAARTIRERYALEGMVDAFLQAVRFASESALVRAKNHQTCESRYRGGT